MIKTDQNNKKKLSDSLVNNLATRTWALNKLDLTRINILQLSTIGYTWK